MTTATIALTELAEKGADIDVLRQMVHVWTRRLLQALVGDGKRSARMYPACLWATSDHARSLDEIRAPCP
jgi:hypothetical protein